MPARAAPCGPAYVASRYDSFRITLRPLAQCGCRPFERTAHVADSLLITALEHPRIHSRRVRENLPRVVVRVVEVKAVGSMLHARPADLVQFPFLRVPHRDAVALVHVFLSLDVKAVMVEKRHPRLTLRLHEHNDIDVIAPQPAPQRYIADLYDLQSEELLVEAPCVVEVDTLQSSV